MYKKNAMMTSEISEKFRYALEIYYFIILHLSFPKSIFKGRDIIANEMEYARRSFVSVF